MMIRILTFIFLLTCVAGAAERPNILLMMVDDLGFSDFGCYGSEIETPRIDRLAHEGLRFSQFYSTAKCHSSRVSLMSGLYCNQAGNVTLSRATTIAEVLGEAGYFTSMAGKWHLDKQPTDFGFNRYWGHLSGSTDYFAGDKTFRLNGEVWNDFDDDFYTTDANIDWSITFLDEALKSGKPFFHYIAFNAPHFPFQAPKDDIEKYLGRYDAGWEPIRTARFEKQKNLELFPQDLSLPPLPEHIPDWAGLTGQQRKFESFRMSIYAAMVDRIDQNIGRLTDWLEEKGELDNTLIMLCSDNGACPIERSRHLDIPPWKGRSYYVYDASWATVGNTPLKHYKQNQHEGGISSPLIVRWPGKLSSPGRWERAPAHLIDIMATCIEAADAQYPRRKGLEPLQGKSLVPLFSGKSRAGHDEIYFEYGGCRALRMGDWKLVSFYQHQWELYNIADDRLELNNLASEFPHRVSEMAARWHELAENKDRLPKNKRKPVTDKSSPDNKAFWHKPETIGEWTPPAF